MMMVMSVMAVALHADFEDKSRGLVLSNYFLCSLLHFECGALA
jgi:hypothetical protein